MTFDLFDQHPGAISIEEIRENAFILRGFALCDAPALLEQIQTVSRLAPWRNLITPGGYTMSVAMTNCGHAGWVSDRNGYRYSTIDPDTGSAWPAMPAIFSDLARRAADASGFHHYECDVCLINKYEIGTKLSLHQDKDERDLRQPIVSVSLGIPAVFLFGGSKRSDRTQKIRLQHGDVVIWGGASRLNFHGVEAIRPGDHLLTGPRRFNLTFRKS